MTTFNLQLSEEDKAMLQQTIQAAVKSEVRDAIRQIQMETSLPEIMGRADVKRALNVQDNKITELFKHRSDFPVSRILGEGTPRVHRDDLIDWLFKNNAENAEEFDMSPWDSVS